MLAFFRILAVRVAYSRVGSLSAPQCKQCNAIGLHLHFHHPLSHTARASGLLLRFSCFSASACPPVKRIAVLFRSSFGSFRRERQPVPRHAAITRLSHARPFSTPHQKLTSLICPDGYRHHPPVFQSVATHDPLPFPRSDSPDFSHADATIVPLPHSSHSSPI